MEQTESHAYINRNAVWLLGIALLIVVVTTGLALQLGHVINLLADFTDIYLFVIALPLGSLGITLIYEGFKRKKKSITSEASRTAVVVGGKSYDLPLHFRNEVPELTLRELFSSAKNEIYLMAMGFRTLHDELPLLDSLLKNNEDLHLKFLIADFETASIY